MRRMYSENQLKEVAAEGIAEGSLANSVVKVKELQEEFDTELIDLNEYVNTGFAKSNSLYAKLIVKHNLLIIVVSGSFVAGSSTSTNPSILNNFMSVLPADIKDKIFRMDGTNLTTNRDSISFIAFTNTPKRIGSTISGTSVVALASDTTNHLVVDGFSFGTITEDTDCQIDARFILTL